MTRMLYYEILILNKLHKLLNLFILHTTYYILLDILVQTGTDMISSEFDVGFLSSVYIVIVSMGGDWYDSYLVVTDTDDISV